jgi:amidase
MEEMSITELQDKMKSGEYTARMITEMYLERIQELDKQGPALNAVLELNPDALAIADALDAERSAKGLRGPLHGIPVMVKDNIDTADKMMTTAGSLALVPERVGQLSGQTLDQWLEQSGRPDPESLRAGSQPLRV